MALSRQLPLSREVCSRPPPPTPSLSSSSELGWGWPALLSAVSRRRGCGGQDCFIRFPVDVY